MANVIITGTHRGIGRSILQKFAQKGSNVWACARKPDSTFEFEIADIARQNNVWIEPVYFDLSSTESIKTGFKQIWLSKKPVDVLVNCAGVAFVDIFQRTTEQKIREVFEINVFSVMTLTQLVLKLMVRQKKGAIVNVSSIGGLDAYPAHCAYGASKAAIAAFTRTLATETGPMGIRVNAVAPGATATDMIEAFEMKANGNLLKNCAMKRKANPSEIADAVYYLASDEASFVNGQILRVDGGSC